MSNIIEAKIEYTNKDDRKIEDPNLPAYKNRINAINNFYSESYNKIWDAIPKVAKHLEATTDPEYTPHSMALEETIIELQLPLDLNETEYLINTETLEITSIN